MITLLDNQLVTMRQVLLGLLCMGMAVVGGCGDQRAPLSPAEATTLADDLMANDGFFWGQPVEVLTPAAPDASGHRWWQLRYTEPIDGPANDRILIVDADSGWAEVPYQGYKVRAVATSGPGGATNAILVTPGSYILLLTPPTTLSEDEFSKLEAEAVHLNAQAATSGLYPLFLARTDDQGRSALVYGWQSDHGIERDTAITLWLSRHTSYRNTTWVDLH